MRVYVAGPYSLGDKLENVKVALNVAEQLAKAGHTPYVPHLSHFWNSLFPHPWDFWMQQDKEWLSLCQAMVVIPGESEGAEAEIAYAKKLNIPVIKLTIGDFDGKGLLGKQT